MTTRRKKLRGSALSPGLAMGVAVIFGQKLPVPTRRIGKGEAKKELERIERAMEETRGELSEIRNGVLHELGKQDADIFEVQLLFLDDPHFRMRIEHKMVEERINAEQAIAEVIEESAHVLESVKDAYLKERAIDIRDVGNRLLSHLMGRARSSIFGKHDDVIVVADELTPSQTAGLDRAKIRGFVTEHGGPTSHAAILARSMGVPVVSGVKGLLEELALGTLVIVDGYRGQVILKPSPRDIEAYECRQEEIRVEPEKLPDVVELPSETRDGAKVSLLANIGSPDDIGLVKEVGAEGVGLYRTEMLFLDREDLPSEEEQFEAYKKVVKTLAPLPVTIRTLDVGGDKPVPALRSLKGEANPYLGLRAIRVSLQNPDMFRTQLRAILRAGAHGKVKILLPMISSLEEIRHARAHLKEAIREVSDAGQSFDGEVPLGVMIEIPSTAIIIDAMLREVDFVSIGTNDLIQYTLAVDRSNDRVSALYDPLNPAVLQLLGTICDAARRAGKEVSICGEMAGEGLYTELLVGLGFRVLSMSSHFVVDVKRIVRSLTTTEAKEMSQTVLATGESAKTRRLLHRSLRAKGVADVFVH